MNDAEPEFGPGMATLGGEHIPPPCLGEVAIATDAACVQKPELRLGIDKALLRRLPAPTERFRGLRFDGNAVRENQIAVALGEFFQSRRSGIIPPRGSDDAPPRR